MRPLLGYAGVDMLQHPGRTQHCGSPTEAILWHIRLIHRTTSLANQHLITFTGSINWPAHAHFQLMTVCLFQSLFLSLSDTVKVILLARYSRPSQSLLKSNANSKTWLTHLPILPCKSTLQTMKPLSTPPKLGDSI